MGERNNPDGGETALAAATAAIITARWSSRPAAPTSPSNGHNGSGHDGAHGANGNGNGLATGSGLGEWAPAGPADWPAPTSPALTAPTPGSGLPPVSPAPAAPYGAQTSPAAPYSPATPYAPTAPVSPAPQVPAQPAGAYPLGAAAASIFSVVAAEPVPEVFDARSGLPARGGATHDEVRTQVPPGFERRTFGPLRDEPEPAGRSEPRGPGRSEEPRAPEGLLGVLPPAAPSTGPMPATFAPPEPAPWVDAGWVDFPRDVDPAPADPLVGAGAAPTSARPLLPRRVPRIPDDDYPLFESDPGEPTPDPATQRQELSRIAHFLRDPGTADTPAVGRPDGIDLAAVLAAVRQVPEVRDAQLGWNAQAGQTLRIEFADGVDQSAVTRSVVRLLRSRLGLTEPPREDPTLDRPYSGRAPARPGAGAPVAGGRALPRPAAGEAPRLIIDNVAVTRLGAEATVEVRLRRPGSGAVAVGQMQGPGVDAYLSRLAATAAANAVNQALGAGGMGRGKAFIEHVSVVPFGVVEVAVVVLLLSHNDVTEQFSGSAIVTDDPHTAVVRAVLAALNRRLESLLA
jgi:hypothetical protein